MAAMAYNLKKLLKHQGKGGHKDAISNAIWKSHRYFETVFKLFNLKTGLLFNGNPGMC